ncbi:MAG: PadR family transcriptional regulator [Solirubrobacteraceae bacterium]
MDPHGHLDGMLLAIAADGPVHGYAAAQALRERSGGVFDLPEGTIYPALHRLERAGLLRSGWSTASGRRRRIYRLTARGERAAASARGDWRRFSAAVEAVLA